MSFPNLEIGEIIRKIRKDRGLRLGDLADENISLATISNIERGVPHVSTDKAMYLLKKLDIDLKSIPELLMGKREEIENVNFKLLGVESLFSNGRWERALNILDSLELEDAHPFAAKSFYLKGKCLIKGGRWRKAERSLHKAIQLASQKDDEENIEAASFNELAIICYHQNDMEQAIRFAESGLDAFNSEGKRSSLYWLLNLNKALYLERLGKLTNSMQVILGVWDSLESIRESNVVLTYYWLRSELLRRLGQFEGTESYALEGIHLARRNNDQNLLFELWTVLGTAYVDQEKWDRAEFSFEQALALTGPKEHKFITAYAWLGKLHTSQREWDKALSALEKAVSLGEKYNDASRYGEALQYMGDYYRKKGDPDSAIKFYQQAMELAQKHNLKKKEYTALFRLAQCWKGKDEEEFQRATVNMYEIQADLEKEGVQPFEES